ncbi:polysaccharide deacetylase [Pseudomonas syringae KCTC 12500]|uniref:Polysaccharide deacetylase family protein n=1 Tax=Pseudomonas syringae pv. syringae TaxID=321 RepID=A0AB35JMY2_PSESY|nr:MULTISPECIES: polysaccharide deacetylase family protein [Pseudomonas]KMY04598.1 polysaccharide deacetylase [Pseudomonas syringae KCTC 12500]KPY67758.1 Polysaccharide deacetylase family protein [Pseudomonas syringae pv. syringae]MBP1087203.1 peptidoglycan/xylan/chitin deacetylase (PgdA/CDA1 family) [Pseudomonas sp. PvP007]MBP1196965.1 peptidoglycan/xylan/chitin deacetylase (PgdA/CDA1 family) [Pseudomonas sp. PvP100]MDC3736217.1 polysaccharide deacetylase family protein [Pseudomonas syringae 
MRIVLAVCAGLFWLQAQAAAPVIATIDRSVWPERLETPGLFDVASRAEILAFAHELYLSEKLDEEGLKQRLGLRFVNVPSLNVVRHRLWLRLLENYQNAQKSCEQDANFCVLVEDMDQLRQRAEEYQVSNDSFYANWARPGAAFHQRYLNELLFMAALFPQTSSEIERYNSDEMSGDEMPDRTFMLNFESGPSPADGGTDWLADFMRQQKMTATFFVLGKSLQERLDSTSVAGVQALYRQQCVGIQGWEYRSHSQWLDWQDSVRRSAALVQQVLPDNFVPLFRPPYGHRRADSGDFFRAEHLRVSLWNIDAEDDTGRLSAEQVGDRVLTLMLLWRKGTVVFHDVANKAQSALPLLLANTAQSELIWDDCRNISEAPEEQGLQSSDEAAPEGE